MGKRVCLKTNLYRFRMEVIEEVPEIMTTEQIQQTYEVIAVKGAMFEEIEPGTFRDVNGLEISMTDDWYEEPKPFECIGFFVYGHLKEEHRNPRGVLLSQVETVLIFACFPEAQGFTVPTLKLIDLEDLSKHDEMGGE